MFLQRLGRGIRGRPYPLGVSRMLLASIGAIMERYSFHL
jgi:hypothetical protein